MNTQLDPLAQAPSRPDAAFLNTLVTEFTRCAPLSGSWNRQADADATRYCRWPHQSSDGRKHDHPNKPAFPWDGASDTRPFIADAIINERVALLTSAFWRAITRPKVADDNTGQYAVALADYFVNECLTDDLAREVELAANHQETYGWVVINPCWEQRLALRQQTVTLQDLITVGAQLAQQFPDNPAYGELAQIILDPTQDEHALALLQDIYDIYARQQVQGAPDFELPPVGAQALRRAITELRRDGKASVPVPYLCKNGPAIYALRPWDEVFVPDDTTDLQRARFVYQREWVTEADLRSRVTEDGYDSVWVEEAVKQKGHQTLFANGERGPVSSRWNTSATGGDLIEVIHAVYRSVNDHGVPVIWCTTFHTQVKTAPGSTRPLYAKHGSVDYPHGQYPYVEGRREYVSRCLTASRGVPEIVATTQNEVKALRDGIIDWTSLGVIPPVNTYKSAWDTKYRFGPAVQNMVIPGKEPRFMEIPSAGVPAALQALERIDLQMATYFHLTHPMLPPDRAQAGQARAVQNWLLMWSRALQQIVALAQSYMADAEFARITGAPEGWLEQNRQRLGVLAVELAFDVRELNEELTMKRIEAVNTAVLPSDVQGVVSRNKWVEFQLRAINPAWAKELVMPASEASDSIYNAVRNDIAQMFLGNPPNLVENDPTAGAKLQFARQIIEQNPHYQQALAQTESRFAQLMQLYAKNLTFSVTQEQNKQIGRIGVNPEAAQTA